jgi:hypothetical protein
MYSRSALAVEAQPVATITEDAKLAHRAYVVSAIVQSTAALEDEIYQISSFGPGHHLGSDRTDQAAQQFLAPLAAVIDDQDVLTRYDLVLHLLRLPRLDFGAPPCQDARLVIKLRNEIVHHKSRWGSELEREKLWAGLRQKRLPRPTFVTGNVNFFPHECLSGACAAWAVDTAVAFLDRFYERLGMPTPLEHCRASLIPR